MLFLSIIIPMYNVEKYIEKCIKSIYDQDVAFSDYEVIVVDDGSTDCSSDKIESLIPDYQTLKLIRQQNKHAGGARNTGLRHAQGKYVLFIDPDDFVLPCTFSKLLSEVKKNDLDILMGDHFNTNINELKRNSAFSVNSQEILSGRQFLKQNKHAHFVWQYLFKRSFLIENDFFFRENIARQDVDYVIKVIYGSLNIKYVPIFYYNYIYRENSTINLVSITTFLADIEMITVVNKFNEEIVKNEDTELYVYFQKLIWGSLNSYFKKSFSYSCKDVLLAFRKIKNSKLLKSLKIYDLRGCVFKYFTNLYILSLLSMKPLIHIYSLRLKFK